MSNGKSLVKNNNNNNNNNEKLKYCFCFYKKSAQEIIEQNNYVKMKKFN